MSSPDIVLKLIKSVKILTELLNNWSELFSFYLLIGLFFYKDFGINIEEHLQRYSGLYWLDYTLNFFNTENLNIIVENKLKEAFDPYLPNIKNYGVIFDLPLAYI